MTITQQIKSKAEDLLLLSVRAKLQGEEEQAEDYRKQALIFLRLLVAEGRGK